MRPHGLCVLLLTAACAGTPEAIPPEDTVAAVFGPAAHYPADDGRGRFREVYCAISELRGEDVPANRPCEEVFRRLGPEPAPTGRVVDPDVDAGAMHVFFVFGFGWDCFAPLLGTGTPVMEHVESLGYRVTPVPTEGLASGARNATIIHETVMSELGQDPDMPVILVGYSKGVTDILEALVTYPDLASRTDAVVSLAGSIRGSALADDATQSQANLLTEIPGSECDESDGGAVEALRPDLRIAWLEQHRLPASIAYYSLVTMPQPARVSWVLERAYHKLGEIDPRNDSQVIFSDQVIPGSTVLGFIDADHWAIAVPVDRSRPLVANTVIDENDFPREVLLEAVMLYVKEDLDSRTGR